MKRINLKREACQFAENEDIAKRLREEVVLPSTQSKKDLVIDFTGVEGTTQSFVHALISDCIRRNPESLDVIVFKGCNGFVQTFVETVVEYSQLQSNA